MKFLCLCYYDAAGFAALAPADMERIGSECAPRDKALHDSGHLVLVGSLDEASEIAGLHPGAKLGKYFGGGIEIRPVDYLAPEGSGAGAA